MKKQAAIKIANSMDALQTQIIELTQRFDTLQQIMERLTNQIDRIVSDKEQQKQESDLLASVASVNNSSLANQKKANPTMEHKDILLDGSGWESDFDRTSEQTISPEIQIRRLTAQLTAAYNRIAALEEQLLARRIHS
ncbi:MAG: hypothetical protein QNJ38_10310 [Prochloraceae cyanobacterium]|nr:hypothetical protein [Prochloraceae cyanobacterium]